MRFAIIPAIVILLASVMAGCFCPLWDQGCGGKIETEGVDYVKYSGVVKDSETGKPIAGIAGASVLLYRKDWRDTPLQTGPDGTFDIMTPMKHLAYRLSVTAPGYEPYVTEVTQGQHQFVILLKPLHQSR